jgi:protoporphyrinogen oxidase
MSVAVLGAGVTGLTCAWLLARAGRPVRVYEASPAEGGLAATLRHDGFAFDLGPHEFVSSNPQVLALISEACGDDLIRVSKRTAQYFRGRFLRYPFEIPDLLRKTSPLFTGRALLGVAAARLRSLGGGNGVASFRDWTLARFGRTLYDQYFEPYTRKVWGIDPAELDFRTAVERIPVASFWQLVRKALALQVRGVEDMATPHSEFRHSFLYTRGGAGTFQRHLRARVEEQGGTILFEKRLAGVEVRDGAATRLEFADGTVDEGFDTVVSTIPLPALGRLVLGADAVERADLSFRGMVFVMLRVDRPRVTDCHWIYFPEPHVPFQRITEFNHFAAGMTPPGLTGLTLELSANPGDATWTMSDDATVATCVRSLESLGLLRASEVLGADVVRLHNVYPLQTRGFRERAESLLNALGGAARNVVSIGRQGLFRYCNQDECMEMAIGVATRLLEGSEPLHLRGDPAWRGVGVDA